MDILVPSNLSFWFSILWNDIKTAELMNALNTQGQSEQLILIQRFLTLCIEYVTEASVNSRNRRVYEAGFSYIEDPS